MGATFQTSLNGRSDWKQILVTVAANEVGTDIDLPALGASAVPGANDQVQVVRILPTDNTVADPKVTFKSKTSGGSTTFSSPAIQLSGGQPLGTGEGNAPIFAAARGDKVAINADAAGSFIVFTIVVDRYAAATSC